MRMFPRKILKREITKVELEAYIGLELAMGLSVQNSISDEEKKKKVPKAEAVLGVVGSEHYLLKNLNGEPIQCFVCKLVSGRQVRSTYSCVECQRGYHVDCFTAFHFRHSMRDNLELQTKIMKALSTNTGSIRARKSKYVNHLCGLVLECEKTPPTTPEKKKNSKDNDD